MSKLTKPSNIIIITVLYTIVIFYLSVTSSVSPIKRFIKINIFYNTRDFLVQNGFSSAADFLTGLYHHAADMSLDIGHIGIYAAFGLLLYFAFLKSKNKILNSRPALAAVYVGSVYGLIMEIIQFFTLNRKTDMADVFSNMMGLALAQLALVMLIFGLKGFILLLESIQKKKKEEL
ncbi:hypothetical protein FTO70_07225 [Methanosarcina sp. KYL-1]|uniref:VanZ family protein n=1 Tax=Methanosarcina sp. KYL-1 TaxID=2602068 RepID=UPI0021010E42|nr:VanZ family protein [Methanosarcina sp. KYL-1]MCQ1535479.1 hypothetical protein [Methanosarcina sp. KYL-1]